MLNPYRIIAYLPVKTWQKWALAIGIWASLYFGTGLYLRYFA